MPLLVRCAFFSPHHYLSHISTDIKRHQIQWNRPWFSSDVKKVAGTLPSEDTWQNALWGWLLLRKCLTFFTHITHCLLNLFCTRLHWRKREAVLNECHTSLKSYITLYYYANSGCHGVCAKKSRKDIWAGGLWLKCSPFQYCKYSHWQFY